MKRLNERLEKRPCQIGLESRCCKNCLMGPCILINKDDVGACGANADVVSARNIVRFTAAGASNHTGHAEHILQFTKKKFPEKYIDKKAPKYLLKLWKQLGILPSVKHEHFKEISEAFHATSFGVNADYQDLLKTAVKLGIIDGYLGLYLATELEDKLYGKPKVREGVLDLGVIRDDKINIAVHGHEPMFAEEIVKEAKKHKNINVVGVCCTGASLLAKHGVPLAANVILQENVIATGMVEIMAVDAQCVMPSLVDICECYHTRLITTNSIAKISGATHMPVTDRESANIVAKKIIKLAIENRKKRKRTSFSAKKEKVIVGFDERIADSLHKQLKEKKIKGIIAVIGCRNPRVTEDWISVYRKLSKDYAILTTGCMAFELGKAGMLDGRRVFHVGSCINNARIAEIFKRIADKEKKEITDLPFIISAPAPLSEKCVAIGFFFAALGTDVHFGYPMMIKTNSNVENFLANVLKKHFKSRIFFERDPKLFYKKIVE
ncbi:MAG: hypothetical protein KJ697_00990 [Nanoarchaeota archaeon]|nr:hypothetical protein [Nanoarchaeota archaeon]MBU4124358.1 hypothetical protein [Nanoarchaeota archaeon]